MTDCFCPDFTAEDEKKWDGGEIFWEKKSFYTFEMPMLFHVPRLIKRKINKSLSEISDQGYQVIRPLHVMSREGWFGGQMLIEIQDTDDRNPRIYTFRQARLKTTVFREKYQFLSRAAKDFAISVERKGDVVTEIYYWYVTCPECADEKGYKTVLMALME